MPTTPYDDTSAGSEIYTRQEEQDDRIDELEEGQEVPTPDYIDFDLAFAEDMQEGRMAWDSEDGTVQVGLADGNVVLQVGQEQLLRVTNDTSTPIANGAVVYINGASGDKPTVSLADADSMTSAYVLGVATETITTNGYVTIIGLVRDLDTSSFSAGDALWLSQTEGEVTAVKPTAPAVSVFIGYAIVISTIVGVIAVRPTVVPRTQWLSDVYAPSLQGGDSLVWSEANSRFEALANISVTGEPTGFDRLNSETMGEFSFVDGTRTFTIEPASGESSFKYWVGGECFSNDSADTLQISDVEGIHVIYYDGDTLSESVNPSSSDVSIAIKTMALISILYWDFSEQECIYLGEERHGISMDGMTHSYLHFLDGCRYASGLGLNSILADESGDLDTHAQFGVDVGGVYDEDIYIHISAIVSTVGLPIYYMVGSDWKKHTKTGFSMRTIDDTDATRLAYNQYTGGAWQLTEVTNNDLVLCHIFATTEVDNPMIAVIGQNIYTNKNSARAGALTEIHSLITNDLLFPEIRAIATVIFQTGDGKTNEVKAEIVSTDEGDDYIDWRSEVVSRTEISTSDHGVLTGLGDDDHTQYMMADGSRDLTDIISYDGDKSFASDHEIISKKYADDLILASTITGIYRNAIINGNMEIAQRGTSFPAIADHIFPVDRFEYRKGGGIASVHTGTQDIDVPNSLSQHSLKLDCTIIDGSPSSTSHCHISHKIEGYNFFPYVEETGTLSFWVKATKTGVYCVSFRNSGYDRSYVVEYTVNASDTWEKKTITLDFDFSGGTWDYANGIGLNISWALAMGSTYQTTSDVWQTGIYLSTANQVNACDSTSNNFFLSQVQLNKGSEALDFQPRHYEEELALCQRYYESGSSFSVAVAYHPQYLVSSPVEYKVEKRIAPSVIISSLVTVSFGDSNFASMTTILGYSGKVSSHMLTLTGATVAQNTAGHVTQSYTADAEL